MADTFALSFDKSKTSIIKGFAIVFMIVLHVFGGAGWYDAVLPMNDDSSLIHWMGTLKICVGIFTFMVGYGYAFSLKKDFYYSWCHSKKLLVVFWVVLFGFALPAGYDKLSGGGDLLLNMFAIKSDICWVSWFVHFYLWAMLVMPFIGRLIDRKPILFSAASIVVVFVSEIGLHELWPSYKENPWVQVLFNCLVQSPCMILGYLFARRNWFGKIRLPRHAALPFGVIILAFATLCMRRMAGSILGFNLDFFYAPVMIFCILALFGAVPMKGFARVMAELGDKSVYMWFFHGLFFTAATRAVYQPLIMVSDNLWVISVWTLLLTYLGAVVLKKAVEY